MMNLADLNKIANEEKELLEMASRFDRKAQILANNRNNMLTLSKFISQINPIRPDSSPLYQEINSEVLRIADSMSHDVFRAVELKFAAEARELRIEAKLKNQQIKNFLPDNEVL